MFNQVRLWAFAGAALMASTGVSATTFTFDSDPFAGSSALTTPGRQIVGGEPSINFDVTSDVFAFDQAVFGIGSTIIFANDVVGNLPTSGLNVIVLQTLDNDANAATPFAAGSAANLLAGQVTGDGAGFFIYFNSGLDLPRLVYSTNLSDETADLAILARLSNFTGDTAALSNFTAANFEITAAAVPEPSTWMMMLLGFGATGYSIRRTRKSRTVSATAEDASWCQLFLHLA